MNIQRINTKQILKKQSEMIRLFTKAHDAIAALPIDAEIRSNIIADLDAQYKGVLQTILNAGIGMDGSDPLE